MMEVDGEKRPFTRIKSVTISLLTPLKVDGCRCIECQNFYFKPKWKTIVIELIKLEPVHQCGLSKRFYAAYLQLNVC